MWLLLACGSALFAGITAIVAKIGIRHTDSNLATALRTIVVLCFSWLMVFLVGSQHTIRDVDAKSLFFLVLSGLSTGISWLCYFRALRLGDIHKVVPVDKSSTVLTLLLAFLFLGEGMGLGKLAGMLLIGAGTYVMIERKAAGDAAAQPESGRGWFFYAALSALFASLTSILGKVGIQGIESNLGTAIRTIVVLIMAWVVVFTQGKQRQIRSIDGRSWRFIALSGLTTGLSWLCYYRALQLGPTSVVASVDKMSILITIAFGWIVFREKLTAKAAAGLVVLTLGTLILVLAQ